MNWDPYAKKFPWSLIFKIQVLSSFWKSRPLEGYSGTSEYDTVQVNGQIWRSFPSFAKLAWWGIFILCCWSCRDPWDTIIRGYSTISVGIHRGCCAVWASPARNSQVHSTAFTNLLGSDNTVKKSLHQYIFRGKQIFYVYLFPKFTLCATGIILLFDFYGAEHILRWRKSTSLLRSNFFA